MEELVELVELKKKLSDIITENHKIDNLINIILFKSKVNGEIKQEEQDKLDDLNRKLDELSTKEKEIRERIEELRKERN